MVGVAGAGFAGAVVARELAEAGHRVEVHEARTHVGGACYTERDAPTGVLVHRYGPHIFHTADEQVWTYVRRFGAFENYEHRVKANAHGRVYGLPINLHTINQLFGTAMGPEEAQAFVAAQAEDSHAEPTNLEEQALKLVGRRIYEAFILGYTLKQWGRDPRDLPASVLGRIRFRFDYDDRYFAHPHQAMPRHGYTTIVQAILDHPAIEVRLGEPLSPTAARGYDHVVWTGPLDEWFGWQFGRLGYRTLDFEPVRANSDLQGCAVMNYCDLDIPYTRVVEHKHLAPWEVHDLTIAFREYSRSCGEGDIPFYPVRLANDHSLLNRYLEAARNERGVSFVGRLGTYRYLDMDVTIGASLRAARAIIDATRSGGCIPALLD